MKKILELLSVITLVFCINSCIGGEEKIKVLIEGVVIAYDGINVRTEANANSDETIIYTEKPGGTVEIVSFNTDYDNGISWCEIKLDESYRFTKADGQDITTGWMVYRKKRLPWIVSNESWDKIERMYEMEYEKENNEILTGGRTWLTQAIYDYVYNTSLRDIQYEHDLRGAENKYEDDNPKSKYKIESPSHSVDFDEEQHCRVRITTASADRDETALYAVIFNQSPRTIHFFRQDDRSLRGKFVYSQDFSYNLSSDIKNIERRTKRVYYRDYYGDKTRLELNYDAIRIRPRSGKQRYIIYNPSGYTNANMDGSDLDIIEEYRR